MSNVRRPLMSRREASQGILLAFGGVFGGATSFVSGCGDGATSASGLDAGGATGSLDASALGDSSTAVDATADAAAGAWASGGTKSMTDAASYPNPFTGAGGPCVLAATATEGPCTEAANQVRRDISEGYTGLPMRLALRAVDASCAPIVGATVKVWHTQVTGSYSGETPNAKDNVVGKGNLASFTLATARMSDGAMLASKQLVVSVA